MDLTSELEELAGELVDELKTELSAQPTFDKKVLELKVNNAIRDVMQRRNYGATSYTNAQISDDLTNNYYSTIRELALFDFAHIGAPGESRRSENSVDRTWVERDSLLRGVHAFVKVLT